MEAAPATALAPLEFAKANDARLGDGVGSKEAEAIMAWAESAPK
jgi:hypothetical protein